MSGGERQRKRTAVWRGLGVLAVLALVAAAAWLIFRSDAEGSGRPGKAEEASGPAETSAWLADWQWEAGLADLDRTVGGLDSLQVFAAYFDESDRLFFTEEFAEGFPRVRERAEQEGVRMDLTLVNDIVRADGTESQKDPELLSRLLEDEASRSVHIGQIVAAVERYGFDGVELDYEKVKDEDWARMISLIEELQAKMDALGKPLRVVLEPRAPLEEIELPEGPAYVMMAYNLYGGHSGPGPKANEAFILELADRMESVPGTRYIALSAGGFDWIGDGDAEGITEREAGELAKKSVSEPVRDEDSGSLRFEYADEEGRKHTVWYADGETLGRWASVVRGAGIPGVAVWRLGELGEESLSRFGTGFDGGSKD